jgi:hypothetical protein
MHVSQYHWLLWSVFHVHDSTVIAEIKVQAAAVAAGENHKEHQACQ